MCFWLLQQKFGGSKFPNLVLHGVIEASLHQGTARHWRIVPPPRARKVHVPGQGRKVHVPGQGRKVLVPGQGRM